jgi:hypothetical protein
MGLCPGFIWFSHFNFFIVREPGNGQHLFGIHLAGTGAGFRHCAGASPGTSKLIFKTFEEVKFFSCTLLSTCELHFNFFPTLRKKYASIFEVWVLMKHLAPMVLIFSYFLMDKPGRHEKNAPLMK